MDLSLGGVGWKEQVGGRGAGRQGLEEEPNHGTLPGGQRSKAGEGGRERGAGSGGGAEAGVVVGGARGGTLGTNPCDWRWVESAGRPLSASGLVICLLGQ